MKPQHCSVYEGAVGRSEARTVLATGKRAHAAVESRTAQPARRSQRMFLPAVPVCLTLISSLLVPAGPWSVASPSWRTPHTCSHPSPILSPPTAPLPSRPPTRSLQSCSVPFAQGTDGAACPAAGAGPAVSVTAPGTTVGVGAGGATSVTAPGATVGVTPGGATSVTAPGTNVAVSYAWHTQNSSPAALQVRPCVPA